jgi:hypothetical protein
MALKFENVMTSLGVAVVDNVAAEVDEWKKWTEPVKNSRDASRIGLFAGGLVGSLLDLYPEITDTLTLVELPLAADVIRRAVKHYVFKKETGVKLVPQSSPVVVVSTQPQARAAPQVAVPPIPGRRPAEYY